jgi:hypothetical protein
VVISSDGGDGSPNLSCPPWQTAIVPFLLSSALLYRHSSLKPLLRNGGNVVQRRRFSWIAPMVETAVIPSVCSSAIPPKSTLSSDHAAESE